MLIALASLVVFGALFCLVMALASRTEKSMSLRLANLRGDQAGGQYGNLHATDSIGTRVFGPMADSFGTKFGQLMPTRWVQNIDKSLVQAGQPISTTGFLFVMLIAESAALGLGFTFVLASGAVGVKSLGLMAVLGAFGFFGPKLWLSNRVRYRQKAILKSLPDAFDLVTTCVEAGLGLEAALAKVAEKVEGPFGEELALSLREVSLGKLRRDALKELAERTGVPDLTSFINAVIQAETMGTSIATVLRVQAEQMRIKRRQRAEQAAYQAPVKMIFPLVLCIFPTLFVVILGPAGISIYQQLITKE